MLELHNKSVLVLGLGPRGRAACQFLRRKGARVVAIERGDSAEFRTTSEELRGQGIEVEVGATTAPAGEFDLAVVSPAVPMDSELVRAVARRMVPVMGEVELAFQ